MSLGLSHIPMSFGPRDPCLRDVFHLSISPSYVIRVLSPMLNVLCPPGPCVPCLAPAPATHIVVRGEVALAGLDGKGNEADGSGHPHEALQTARQLPGELDILGGAPRRPQGVGPVPQQQLGGQAGRQALGAGGVGSWWSLRTLLSSVRALLPCLPLPAPPLALRLFLSFSVFVAAPLPIPSLCLSLLSHLSLSVFLPAVSVSLLSLFICFSYLLSLFGLFGPF